MSTFKEKEAKIHKLMTEMRVMMHREFGVSHKDITAAFKRLMEHIGNGGDASDEVVGAIFKEYMPTVEERMAELEEQDRKKGR